MQPDAYAQPCKRASLTDHPHPTGLPIGRRKASKQNSCRWQYKISLQRRLLTITSDLPGAYHQAKDIIVAPGEPILYSQRLLFCFLWACDVMRSRTGGVCHGAAAKTRGLEQRPMTESPRSTDLLSPQKLFDLIIRSIRLIRTNPC